jgi:hypothetical protein
MFGKGGHDEQAPVPIRICRVCDVSGPGLRGESWILAKVSALQVGAGQYKGDRGYVGQDEIACDNAWTCDAPTAHRIPCEEDASSANPMLRLLSTQG